jgi:RNA polymerase sigma-70 factor (ECF subfamily)
LGNIPAAAGVFIGDADSHPMRHPNTDQTLVERLRTGDENALGELARAYGARIEQLAFRYLHNHEDAEEVAQDVLYKVFRKISAFRGDAALSSWIYRITFNAAMSRLRSAKRRRGSDEPQPHAEPDTVLAAPVTDIVDWSNMADERVYRLELRRRVAHAVKELPAIYRAPVVLRDFHGLSTEEASALLRVKDQTLKSRLHRGRLILRRELADFRGGLALHHAQAA